MKTIHKKLVVDEQGQPIELAIPWAEYQEMATLLSFDLDEEVQKSLNLDLSREEIVSFVGETRNR